MIIILPLVGEWLSKKKEWRESWTEIRALLRADPGVWMRGFRCTGVTWGGKSILNRTQEPDKLWKRKEIVQFVTVQNTGTREGDTSQKIWQK